MGCGGPRRGDEPRGRRRHFRRAGGNAVLRRGGCRLDQPQQLDLLVKYSKTEIYVTEVVP